MSDKSKIEWTDATWNPVTGCTKVSPGCDHCYAETIAHRFAGTKAYPNGFEVTLRPERLDQPLRWKRPRRIFVNSMSDLFHAAVSDEYIARVFAVMALAPQHTFQVLTKRPGRMRSLLSSRAFEDWVEAFVREEYSERWTPNGYEYRWPLPNVWLGVSVESQKWADVRIPQLLATPAAVQFLSCEPLLGPVQLDLIRYFDADSYCRGCSGLLSPKHEPACGTELGEHSGIDWVIVGGESGSGARPMHPDWARMLRNQCVVAGVPFLFKQWGEWAPQFGTDGLTPLAYPKLWEHYQRTNLTTAGREATAADHEGAEPMMRVGKRAAGRELDGRTWDEYPEVGEPR